MTPVWPQAVPGTTEPPMTHRRRSDLRYVGTAPVRPTRAVCAAHRRHLCGVRRSLEEVLKEEVLKEDWNWGA
jgi:hypothetical protein